MAQVRGARRTIRLRALTWCAGVLMVATVNLKWAMGPNTNPAGPFISPPRGMTEDIDDVRDDGVESQFAEVAWVMGVQERRRNGMEPSDVDPYANIPLEVTRNVHIRSFAFKWLSTDSLTSMHFVHVPKCGGTSITK